jgi:hypothetical protein
MPTFTNQGADGRVFTIFASKNFGEKMALLNKTNFEWT